MPYPVTTLCSLLLVQPDEEMLPVAHRVTGARNYRQTARYRLRPDIHRFVPR